MNTRPARIHVFLWVLLNSQARLHQVRVETIGGARICSMVSWGSCLLTNTCPSCRCDVGSEGSAMHWRTVIAPTIVTLLSESTGILLA